MTASSVVLYRMSFPITMHSQQYDSPLPFCISVFSIWVTKCMVFAFRALNTHIAVFSQFHHVTKIGGAGDLATTVPRRSLTCPSTLGDVMPTVTCHRQERPSSQLRCTNTASAGLAHRGNTDINNLAGGGRTFNNVLKRFKLTVPCFLMKCIHDAVNLRYVVTTQF